MSSAPVEVLTVYNTPTRPGLNTALAELPPEAYLDAEALGKLFGRSKKTIQRAVRRGELPAPIQFLGRHVWLVGCIQDHFQARQRAAILLQKQRHKRREQRAP